MDWMTAVIWIVSLYFAYRFGKGFGKSLVELAYKWKCYMPDCTFRISCTDANVLMAMSLAHLDDFHKPEVQDGATTSPEEGSR